MITHTYVTMDVSKQACDEIKRKLLAAGYDHAVHVRNHGEEILLDMQGIALTNEEVHPSEAHLPAVISLSQRGEIADILLNMLAYKHGPASAREWVDGVLQAIEEWDKRR